MARSRGAVAQRPRSDALPNGEMGRRRPIRAGGEERAGHEAPSRGGHSESSAPQPSWYPRSLVELKVVIVDDDEGSRDYFAMALTIAGAVVATASTATDALRAVQEHRPDVVLSDIAMPGRDGYWLVREIRRLADAAIQNVPVIATTAFGRVHSRERALAAGFVEHLAKPVEPDVLCRTIARVAGRIP